MRPLTSVFTRATHALRGRAHPRTADARWAPTVLRAYVGLTFLLYHGSHKVVELATGDTRFIDAVATLGFPAPRLFAWLAALTHVGAAVLLLLGVASRLAALALTATMLVAIAEKGPGGFLAVEPALSYAVLGAVLAATGPGRLALGASPRAARRLHPADPALHNAFTQTHP